MKKALENGQAGGIYHAGQWLAMRESGNGMEEALNFLQVKLLSSSMRVNS